MPDDPRWPRASAWLAGVHEPDPVATLAVIGAPIRLGSISGGRFDLAPGAIRAALARFSTWDGERDIRRVRLRDQGDLDLARAAPADTLASLSGAVGGSLPTAEAIVVVGGDNSVTRPSVRGLGVSLARAGLVTLDAHHDLRDTAEGLTNGNPVRALLEDGLPGANVWQIGIQPFANSPAYAGVAREHGIQVVTVDEVRRRGSEAVIGEALEDLASRTDAIHVDLDVDVLDRAFAPACPGSRAGGLIPHDLFAAARAAGRHPLVRAIDIVEIDPERDIADVTVLAAARCVLEFAAGLAVRGSGGPTVPPPVE